MAAKCAFVVLYRDGRPFLVRRGEYLGYPSAPVVENEPYIALIKRALGNHVHIYREGRPRIVEGATGIEYMSQTVDVIYLILEGFMVAYNNREDGSHYFSDPESRLDFIARFHEDLRRSGIRGTISQAA